jgi:arabinogalactan oligomer/maltooligosaccharide transport system permease protein
MIDGASKLQIFIWIILPLAVPILTFVAVSMFMGPWMDYMLPGYLLRYKPENAPTDYNIQTQWTLAVGLFNFINDPQLRNYSAFAAGALMVGLPITVLYMIFQRYLIEGIMAGATKG